jgi:hypothetical protein
MSKAIGKWIIRIQDSMPDDMRNSARWKQLLPRAAGTGRAKEKKRLAIILDWMWGTVLPTLQPLADDRGFGTEWKRMTTERTRAAAGRASCGVDGAAARAAAAAAAAWAAAEAAARAEARAAAWAWAAEAAWAWAAEAAAWAAAEAAEAASAWETFDPCGLLERLINVE